MNLTIRQEELLAILKDDSCGSSDNCLKEKFGRGWLIISKQLIEKGLVRLDKGKNGRPDRMKALPAAWE